MLKVLHQLSEYVYFQKPVVLTIGNFDGVHSGHQLVLGAVKEEAKRGKAESVLLTFSNHPLEMLQPERPLELLCTLSHRLRLIEQAAIDTVILLPFTQEFSQQSASQFLNHVLSSVPFSHLILGHDATLGKNKMGDKKIVEGIADQLSFKVSYLEIGRMHEMPVSSTRIREHLRKGEISIVEQLLGRKYSIYAPVIRGQTHGSALGFPTANIDVSRLCLPPLGVYAVKVMFNGQMIKGVANLGVAPTIHQNREIVLEVHLLDWQGDLYHEMVEVVFCAFLRPERKFTSLAELRAQIQEDINCAQKVYSN